MHGNSVKSQDPTWPPRLPPTPFRAQASHGPGWDRLTLEGELDLASAPIVQSELDRVERDPAGMIVLDLRRLSFMDVAGMRAVLEAHQRAPDGWWSLVIVGGPRAVQRVLELAKVEPCLHLIDDPTLAQPERLLSAP